MKRKSQWVGLIILLCVAVSAFALDRLGRSLQPRHYTILFKTGTRLEAGGETQIEKIASIMATVDAYEAIVVGHTGPRGDASVNKALSRSRADFVKTALAEKGISSDRIQTFGVGGEDPLEKRPEEGQRSYYQRLKRVEVTLKR
jgi:outer membrane protein OmpA-like peptidoglycan-associated protein